MGCVFSSTHLNDELSFDIRVENPNALLMIERVQCERLRKVSRMNLARLRCEGLLTAHAIGDEIIRRLVGEAFRAPRVLCYRVNKLDWCPTAQRYGQPFLLKVAAETI